MSNILNFTKMHGAGNDFIVLNCLETEFNLSASLIKKLSNRHVGIGFDQLLVVEKATKKTMDFKYRIYNADGGEVEQCGNGARCFAIYVTEEGLTDKQNINVETNTGEIVLTINADKSVNVDMGKPTFAPKEIPLNIDKAENLYSVKYKNHDLSFSSISIGNPHAVIFKSSIEQLDIEPEAIFLQNNNIFPNSVNVGFLSIIDKNHAKLRVYERGAAETLACGSGACAAIVAGVTLGKLSNSVSVELLGGTVTIDYQVGKHVFLTGPAKKVFKGSIDLDLIND